MAANRERVPSRKVAGVAQSKLLINTDMKLFPIKTTHRGLAVARLFLGLTLATVSGSLASAEEVHNSAKNLARMNCGAKIECITPDGREAVVATATEQNRSAAALIMDDDTLSYPLQEGQTTFIITLPTTSLVDRFTFLNENASARGELKIAVSNDQLPASSSKWVEVDGRIPFTNKRLFNLSMVGVEARYLKLSFDVEKGGRIASLGLYGGETLQRFAQRQQNLTWVGNTVARSNRLEDRLNFNFANLYARARVAQVSSGSTELARRMIDDDIQTGFRFAANDPQPTVIFELAAEERLHRVTARYEMARGRMDVYLLNRLPAGGADLGDAQPVASALDLATNGKAAIEFDPKGARYVALRWTPEERGDRSVFVTEVKAFGNMPLAMLQLNEAPDLYASNFTAAQGTGSSDLSSTTLGTLAVPPSIPVVSP